MKFANFSKLGLAALAAGVIAVTALALSPRSAQWLAPARGAAAMPMPPVPAGDSQATFAAGCFWSMQAIFQQLKGVDQVMPGYAGGTAPHPTYDLVETGDTGYAETLNIVYNPKVISYNQLLDVLLTSRDPTTLNRQGPDEGTQYRSIIFARDSTQKRDAVAKIASFNSRHVWPDPIVTTVQPFTKFYPAESYHFDYYRLHPDQPYCSQVIAPEVAEFRAKFKGLLK